MDEHDPEIDDWFADEEPGPYEERRRVRSSGPDRRPPGGFNPLVLGGVVVAALLVIVVIAFAAGGDDEAGDEAILTTITETEPAVTGPTETVPPAIDALPTEGRIGPGDEGEEVVALQRALTELGYEVGEPDGNYGTATRDAVRRFQGDNGLDADGIAGPQTLRAINAALAARIG
jgi:hypothetical protein